MPKLYLGLMSGTSADGIDAALVEFKANKVAFLATAFTPYPNSTRELILSLCYPGPDEIKRMGELDVILGQAFAEAVQQLLSREGLTPADIIAIGSHGQTLRHAPKGSPAFTLQIGDPNTIAAQTGITTVADFRRKDIALGGQGAPLVPAFHQAVFASRENDRVIVNIGGIANVTLLSKHDVPVIGFDTGPGNVLMDDWIYQQQQQAYDKNGALASQGKVNHTLLEKMLQDPYFKQSAPKSTGRELFNRPWLQQHLTNLSLSPSDVQATLAELTALTILKSIQTHFTQGEIIICGGGARNLYLMQRLQLLGKPQFIVSSSAKYGIDPDWVEAVAFAWLAKQTLAHQPGNIVSVTGAKRSATLGGVFIP